MTEPNPAAAAKAAAATEGSTEKVKADASKDTAPETQRTDAERAAAMYPDKAAEAAKKAAAEKAAAEKAEKEKLAAKDKLAMPENSPLQEEALERIAAEALARKLTNEQAQELLQREHDAVARHVSSQNTILLDQEKTWSKELRADKEFAGQGGRDYERHEQLVDRFLKANFDPEVVQWLEQTGFRKAPKLAVNLLRLARKAAPDTRVTPGAVSDDTGLTPAQRIYGPDGKGRRREGAAS